MFHQCWDITVKDINLSDLIRIDKITDKLAKETDIVLEKVVSKKIL